MKKSSFRHTFPFYMNGQTFHFLSFNHIHIYIYYTDLHKVKPHTKKYITFTCAPCDTCARQRKFLVNKYVSFCCFKHFIWKETEDLLFVVLRIETEWSFPSIIALFQFNPLALYASIPYSIHSFHLKSQRLFPFPQNSLLPLFTLTSPFLFFFLLSFFYSNSYANLINRILQLTSKCLTLLFIWQDHLQPFAPISLFVVWVPFLNLIW